jgi:antitoxin CcdA
MASNVRRRVHVSIDADVLRKARDLKINLARAGEAGMRRAILREEARQWTEENAEVVRSRNEYVRKHGLPLQKYRVR